MVKDRRFFSLNSLLKDEGKLKKNKEASNFVSDIILIMNSNNSNNSK